MGQIIEKKYRAYIQKGLLNIAGKIAPAAITNKLQDAHVVIAPSSIDNLPYAVMEAMSRGKVVLTSIQGGQKEIIQHEVDGFLFDHKQEKDFKKQLFKILSLSDEEIKNCGKRAAQKIRNNYSFQTIYNQKITFLKGLNKPAQIQSKLPFLYQEAFQPLQEETNTILSVVIPY